MSDLMDTTAVAQFMGLKPETIRYYHKFNKMPPADTFFNRTPVWTKSTIEQWKNDRESVITVTTGKPTPNNESGE